jgi:hypothetical protein
VKNADSEASYYLFVRFRRYVRLRKAHEDHHVKSHHLSDARTRHHAVPLSFNKLLRSRTQYVLHPYCDAVQRRRLASVQHSHPLPIPIPSNVNTSRVELNYEVGKLSWKEQRDLSWTAYTKPS